MSPVRERYGEAFWRAHHEAWIESELNQREYCEAHGIALKAFGNWRAKFRYYGANATSNLRYPRPCLRKQRRRPCDDRRKTPTPDQRYRP